MKYYCDALGKTIDSDQKCLCESGGVPSPGRNCVKCDHYRSRLVPTKTQISIPSTKSPYGKSRGEKTHQPSKRVAERLAELSLKKAYQIDFEKLKGRVLAGKKEHDYYTARAVYLGLGEARQMGWKEYFKRYPLRISSQKVKAILKEGNINDHWIVIPQDQLDFKRRWDLQSFFDPSKSCEENFNPFRYRSAVLTCLGPNLKRREIPGDPNDLVVRPLGFFDEEDDPFKIWFEIDMRKGIPQILEGVTKEIETLRRFQKIEIESLKGRPKSACSQLMLVTEVWREKCDGKGLSQNRTALLISQDPRIALDAGTIRKDYLPRVDEAMRKRRRVRPGE